jgi:hypothetical protein
VIHGFPLALAALAATAGGLLWHFKWWPRVVAALFMFAAVMATAGIGPWTQALASVIATGPGLVVLLVILIIASLIVWREVVRKRGHHHVRSPLVAMIFGVTGLLAWGALGRIGALAAKAPGNATAALGQAMAVIHSGAVHHSGRPARAAAAAGSAAHELPILGAGIAVIVGLGVLGTKLHNSGRNTSRGRGRPTGPPPVKGGTGAPAIPGAGGKS